MGHRNLMHSWELLSRHNLQMIKRSSCSCQQQYQNHLPALECCVTTPKAAVWAFFEEKGFTTPLPLNLYQTESNSYISIASGYLPKVRFQNIISKI